MGDLLISGGWVVDPANGDTGQTDVLVRGSSVAAVAPELRSHPGARTIDARDCLVFPGLVDTHVHLCLPFGGAQGHRMLAKAGVTCALDMAGDGDAIVAGLRQRGAGLTVGYIYPLIPGETVPGRDPGYTQIVAARDEALRKAALGLKVLGGHYPLTAEATATVIRVAAEGRCWCAVHAGTLNAGSDIDGLEELIDLADGLPVHVAHVNSYCRGQRTGDPLLEASRAIAALVRAPRARSESYLATINGAEASIENGVPRSNVVKTCLVLGGFAPTAEGMVEAIRAGWAIVQGLQVQDGETVLLSPEAGLRQYEENMTRVGVSFPVNPPGAAIGIALARQQENREFVVTALSTDGGAIPRNTTLEQGLALVAFGALTLDDLVRKACLNPARMMGLPCKGHLSPGADADIAIVPRATGKPSWVIAHGDVIVDSGKVVGQGGRIATTATGVAFLEEAGIASVVAAPDWL
jgi:predicted amidohydrolase